MAQQNHVNYALVFKKHSPMYLMHKYWARKPHNIVGEYIRTYTDPDEVVLDPFCGSGVVAIEAIRASRKGVAIDLDPIATYVTLMTARPFNLEKCDEAFLKLQAGAKDRIYDLYRIRCPVCGKKTAVSKVLIVSYVVKCPNCSKDIIMGRARHAKGKKQNIYVCPSCREDFNYATTAIKSETHLLTSTTCQSCGKKSVVRDPAPKYVHVSPNRIPYWYPKYALRYPSGKPFRTKRRAATLPELFSKTNLAALSILWHYIENVQDEEPREFLRFVFSSMIHLASRLVILKRGKEAGWNVPEYLVMGFHPEYNVWDRFESRYRTVRRGKQEGNNAIPALKIADEFEDLAQGADLMVATQSALDLSNLPDNSIDYVFTDPPYGGSIQYFELDFMRAAWLAGRQRDPRFPLDWWNDEITINPQQNKETGFYDNRLHAAFREINRVLKPGHYMTVTFHNTRIDIYNSIVRAAIFAAFDLEKMMYQPTEHISSKAGFHPYTSAVGDFYLRFRKPEIKEDLEEREIDKERADRIILEGIKQILVQRGQPTTYTDLLMGQNLIYDQLKKLGYRFFGANPANIERVLKDNENKEFTFVEGQGWWFKEPSKYHIGLPLEDRVEEAVVQILQRKIASFDDVLQEVYLNFQNALTPSRTSIARLLEEYGERTADEKWRLRPSVKGRELEHSKMIVCLAEIGKRLGLSVWIGKKEQGGTYDNKALSSWADVQELSVDGASGQMLTFLTQVDVLWLDKGRVSHAFEVEYTTAITEAFNRCSNIPNYHDAKRFIVIPEEREQLLHHKLQSQLLRNRLTEENWKVIFFKDLEAFYNTHKDKGRIQDEDFKKLGKLPMKERHYQSKLDSSL